MFAHLSIAQLKAEMAARGLSTVGMLEKSDFVTALEEYAQRTPTPVEAYEAALEAIALSRAQTQVVEVSLMTFSTAEPLSVRCEACSKDGPSLTCCSKCLRAAYCSKLCQENHWSVHKVACKVDRRDTSEANTVYYINHSCRHGGPNPQTNPPLLAALTGIMSQVMAALDNVTGPSGEAGLWLSFARSATSIHPQLHRALRSCGVDAFVDLNFNAARMFCRVSAFCEQYTLGGEEFLVALEGGHPCTPKGLACLLDFTASVRQSIPRTGMLAMLRAPMNCMCLRPIQLPSSPPPSEGKEEPAAMD